MGIRTNAAARVGVAAILATAAIAIIAGGCSGARSEQYRLEGETYLQLGEIAQAQEAFEKALLADAANASAMAGLARCQLLQGDEAEALENFQEAIALDPSLTGPYAEAANLMLALGHSSEALALAEQLEARSSKEGALLRASVLERTGRIAEAEELLTELAEEFPDEKQVRLQLGQFYLESGKLGEAEAEARAIWDAPGEQPAEAGVLLVDVYKARDAVDELVQEFHSQLEAEPQDKSLQLSLAYALMAAGKTDEAAELAREAHQQQPESPLASCILGLCLSEQGEQEAAAPHLQAAAANVPASISAAALAALARTEGAVQAARPDAPAGQPAVEKAPEPDAAAPAQEDWQTLWRQARIERLLQQRGQLLEKEEEQLRETLIVAALLAGRPDDAEEMADELPDASPLRAFLDALAENDVKTTVEAAQAWVKNDQNNLLAKQALGLALARAGARARALQVYSQCLLQAPENAVAFRNIAQVYLAADMPEFAAAAYRRIIGVYPNNLDAHLTLYQLLRQAGMESDAVMAAETAYALFPQSEAATLNLGKAYFDAGRLQEARDVLRRAISLDEGGAARIALALVLLRLEEYEEAQGVLAEVEESAEVQFLHTLTAALQEDWDRAGEVAAGLALATLNEAQQLVVAAVHLHLQNTPGALELLRPDSAAQDRISSGEMVLLAALGQEPPRPLDEGQQELVQKLQEDSSAAADLCLGLACQRLGLHDAALDQFGRVEEAVGGAALLARLMLESVPGAVELEDPTAAAQAIAEDHASDADVLLQLASAYGELDEYALQRQALQQATEAAPQSYSAWFRLGLYLERVGGASAALPYYRHSVEAMPDDPAANNNLAYCLLVTGGDAQEALALAEKATEAVPGNPNLMHTLGLAQMQAGKLDEARKNLSLALQMRPGEPTLLLDYAKLLIEQDEFEPGRAHAALALRYTDQLGLDFPRRAEAEAIVREKWMA